MTETWIDTFAGRIPKQTYTAQITNSEETGLVIRLFGQQYNAVIDFGVIAGMQIFDEGTLLCCPDCDPAPRRDGYPSTIYIIENGELGRYTAACMGPELYHILGHRQYNIITLNYQISVISRWTPEITVQPASHRL